jgi:ribosomal 30S subunit maturation factor RimM
MRPNHFLPLLAALILGTTSVARAQGTEFREVEDETMVVPAFDLSVADLEDMDIVGPTGEAVGEVEEVLTDAGGNIAIAAEVGGFLDLGEKGVVIPLTQLRLADDKLETTMTREQIEALPEWND